MNNRNFRFKNGTEMQAGTFFCIGKNYAEHAREMGGEVPSDPVVFLKPPAAYLSPGLDLHLPEYSNNIHHEVELVIVIGKDIDSISKADDLNCVAGFGVGVDVTLRDLQSKAKEKGLPWDVAKGFKGSAPISEIVSFDEFKGDMNNLELKLSVNSELRQSGSTSQMERTVETLIEYLSYVFTLRKGDCIFTGTPKGVGRIIAGDIIEAEIPGLTSLRFKAVN